MSRQQHLLQRAIGMVGTEQQLEPEERCEQCRDPEDPAADSAQFREFRAEREREERRDHHEEDERLRDLAPVALREQQVAAVHQECGRNGGRAAHAASSRLRGTVTRDCRRLVRGDERGAAGIQVAADDGGHEYAAVAIEIRVGLVEDPQRRAGEHDPRERDAPSLAGGERRRQLVVDVPDAEVSQRGLDFSGGEARRRNPRSKARFSRAVSSGFSPSLCAR